MKTNATVDVEEGTYRMVTHTAFPRVFVWLGWKNSGLREAHHLLEDYLGEFPEHDQGDLRVWEADQIIQRLLREAKS